MKSRDEILNEIKDMPTEEQVGYLKERILECENMCNYEDEASYIEILAYDFDCLDEFCGALTEAYNGAGLYNKTIEIVLPRMTDELYSKLFYLNPSPIYNLGVAYHRLQQNELAMQVISLAIQSVEDYINTNPAAADLSDKKLLLALSYAEKGMILNEQKKYGEAFELYDKSYNICKNIIAIYFIAHMFYMAKGVDRDIDTSISMLTEIADLEINKKHYNAIYVFMANQELALIYATESGYRNKNKALYRLNRAKEFGLETVDNQIERIEGLIENIEDDPVKTDSDMPSKKSGCYVATCVYGSYDCPPVWTLRRFRDDILSKSVLGRSFIKFYYSVSPTIVRIFGKTLWFHKMWKPLLDKMVKKLSDRGIEDTPYKD